MMLANLGDINPLELYFEVCQQIREKMEQDCSLGGELLELCHIRDYLELFMVMKR